METNSTPNESTEKLITRSEAASILGVKPATLAAWAVKRWYDRDLPVIRIHHGLIRYRLSDVLNFIRKRLGTEDSYASG